ncbi:MAG: hypothetical protein QGH60_24880, partial [Phycisphaerae bacterium]|nr:hypothetical protein [Phycisphaerae bacterium]
CPAGSGSILTADLDGSLMGLRVFFRAAYHYRVESMQMTSLSIRTGVCFLTAVYRLAQGAIGLGIPQGNRI